MQGVRPVPRPLHINSRREALAQPGVIVVMNMPHQASLANISIDQHQGIASIAGCFPRAKQEPREHTYLDSRYPAKECLPPCECPIDPCCVPKEACRQVPDGPSPPMHNCYHILKGCIPVSGMHCFAPCRPCTPKPCPGASSCEGLLTSVADAQRSLSLVLAAVARKLKKAVACANDLDTLLEADQVVSRALADVTSLEQALSRELEQIWKICGPCGREEKDPCGSGRPEPEGICLGLLDH